MHSLDWIAVNPTAGPKIYFMCQTMTLDSAVVKTQKIV